MHLTLYTSKGAPLSGFKYFWAKDVVGFDETQHCARCLRGPYQRAIGKDWQAGQNGSVEVTPRGVLYVCGVSNPYRYSNNFHIALQEAPGEEFTEVLYTGEHIHIVGAKEVPFNGDAANRRFPQYSSAFLTCRNFWFGAHQFPAP